MSDDIDSLVDWQMKQRPPREEDPGDWNVFNAWWAISADVIIAYLDEEDDD